MNKLVRYIKEPWRMVVAFDRHVASIVPDKLFLKCLYRCNMGQKLNLKNPQTFNEKLQWIKLYDRNPLYTTLVDKYAVKEHVAKIIGEEHIIPTLGIWNKFDDIDFDALPDKFVLKCTHSSGDTVICKDKNTFDKAAAKKKLESFLKQDLYKIGREWPYKNVPHRIIAEKYMEDETGELRDYKFLCFNGQAKIVLIMTNRYNPLQEVTLDMFDTTTFEKINIIYEHPNTQVEIKKPENLSEMVKVAETLSAGMAHVRIDLYDVNGKIYFGEFTFFAASGMKPFKPNEGDYMLGNLIKLPQKK